MTTNRPAHPPPESAPAPAQPFRLPDIPEKHPDDRTSFKHLAESGNVYHLVKYLGNPDTTIVGGECYIVPGLYYVVNESEYPDLMVAFDADPDAYEARNGYVVSEQGKAPDFILEIGSLYSASADQGVKKDYYERLGVGELWLFDAGGQFYGFTLRGYRLVDGQYREIEVNEIAPGMFQGHSAALNLLLRGDDTYLGWHVPTSVEHIPTIESERARADAAHAARIQAERARTAAARAAAAEARIQELEAELRRLRDIQTS